VIAEPNAPGHPGIEPRWTSSDKTGVGTALYQHVWFNISHGILNEIYYPRVDRAATRDMGLTVGDGKGWLSEEKRHARHEVDFMAEGVPAYRLTNTCTEGRYRIEKEIIADSHRPVLLQRIRFTPLQGRLGDYRLYVSLAPHLVNGGAHNTAWVGDTKGMPMLFAAHNDYALALCASAPWLKRSAGFVGRSDGASDLAQNKAMTWEYGRAEDGNVALTGEIDLVACNGTFLLVVGFGRTVAEAGGHARAGLQNPFDYARDSYVRQWQEWQGTLHALDRKRNSDGKNCYRIGTHVIRSHESTSFPGGLIASLSIPWGFARGDGNLGGYHVAWPRDLVMAAGGYLAAGANQDALRVLGFLESVQESDGHWVQCLWLDGTPYFDAVQLDETALPILLVDLARREGALADHVRFWPMVRQAAAYLMTNGPASPQDRWEEEAGYTPFTVAAEIAALLAAAELAELNDEPGMATIMRGTADAWHDGIDDWLYVTNSDWCECYGVAGYYNRTTPNGSTVNEEPRPVFKLKNVPDKQSIYRVDHMVTVDALALVRFGIRAADDPRIINTLTVIDDLLKVDTPNGTAWRRYNGDGYGEKADGTAFDQTGIGRAWPLLAAERGHYEVLAGHKDQAETIREDMQSFANEGGMIPEQVWDTDDIPEKELFRGKPTGSGNPLVWAHAEYIKLLRSLRDGKVFDLPPQTVQRYLIEKTVAQMLVWTFGHQLTRLPRGKGLRLQIAGEAEIHWSVDDWQSVCEMQTHDTGFGIHIADLSAKDLANASSIHFTFHWSAAGNWEGRNFQVLMT
jgi:glucoamylase